MRATLTDLTSSNIANNNTAFIVNEPNGSAVYDGCESILGHCCKAQGSCSACPPHCLRSRPSIKTKNPSGSFKVLAGGRINMKKRMLSLAVHFLLIAFVGCAHVATLSTTTSAMSASSTLGSSNCTSHILLSNVTLRSKPSHSAISLTDGSPWSSESFVPVLDAACSPDGSISCGDGGNTFYMCNWGSLVDMGSVAAGDICENGNIVAAPGYDGAPGTPGSGIISRAVSNRENSMRALFIGGMIVGIWVML